MPIDSTLALRVLIIDASDVSRGGLTALLAGDTRFAVMVAAAWNAAALAAGRRPDLIVIDPIVDGRIDVDAIAALAAAAPDSRICVRTAVFDPCSFIDVLRAGADGYLLKGGAGDRALRERLITLARCDVIITERGLARHFRHGGDAAITVRTPDNVPVRLSAKEREVLSLLLDGTPEKEIGKRLGIERASVATYVSRLCRKTGVTNRTQLVARAVREGLLDER